MCQPYIHLGDGKYALGDLHVTVGPMLAQGANIGSYSAFVLVDAIEEAGAFDLPVCQDVERSPQARVLGASRWTNAFLQPPDDARIELMPAMSQDPRLAQEYFENFSRPDKQWERFCSTERIREWLEQTQIHAPQLATATNS